MVPVKKGPWGPMERRQAAGSLGLTGQTLQTEDRGHTGFRRRWLITFWLKCVRTESCVSQGFLMEVSTRTAVTMAIRHRCHDSRGRIAGQCMSEIQAEF